MIDGGVAVDYHLKTTTTSILVSIPNNTISCPFPQTSQPTHFDPDVYRYCSQVSNLTLRS